MSSKIREKRRGMGQAVQWRQVKKPTQTWLKKENKWTECWEIVGLQMGMKVEGWERERLTWGGKG